MAEEDLRSEDSQKKLEDREMVLGINERISRLWIKIKQQRT
jgi:hypothetical protein